MDLLEHQGKQLFGRHGLAVSDGKAVTTVEDAVAAADAAVRELDRDAALAVRVGLGEGEGLAHGHWTAAPQHVASVGGSERPRVLDLHEAEERRREARRARCHEGTPATRRRAPRWPARTSR